MWVVDLTVFPGGGVVLGGVQAGLVRALWSFFSLEGDKERDRVDVFIFYFTFIKPGRPS